MALWQSQMEDHTSDWLRVVPIYGLGQTMNDKTYRCVLCYQLGDPLFSVSKSCLACSKVFTGDIYGDHAVSYADMLLNSWDEGLDVCVDLTRSSPLTQTGMVDFVPGRAVIDAAHRKRVKYEAKCANIGYDIRKKTKPDKTKHGIEKSTRKRVQRCPRILLGQPMSHVVKINSTISRAYALGKKGTNEVKTHGRAKYSQLHFIAEINDPMIGN
ncbi:hypothetical protein Tco_0536677 [Tanacetum coccineum]